MILGIILGGMLAGGAVAIAALIAGQGVWVALALYAGCGILVALGGAVLLALNGMRGPAARPLAGYEASGTQRGC